MSKAKPGEPLIEATDVDLAWAAGIVDGEGCIMVAAYNQRNGFRRHELRLIVSNTNAPMLNKLRSLFGGAITKLRKPTPTRRAIAEWRIVGVRAAAALARMRPYLIGKCAEADLGIEMAATLMKKKDYNAISGLGAPRPPLEVIERREAIMLDLRRLKRIEYTFNDFLREVKV